MKTQQRIIQSSLLRFLIVCRNLSYCLCSFLYGIHRRTGICNKRSAYYVSVTSSLLLSALLLQCCRESSVFQCAD